MSSNSASCLPKQLICGLVKCHHNTEFCFKSMEMFGMFHQNMLEKAPKCDFYFFSLGGVWPRTSPYPPPPHKPPLAKSCINYAHDLTNMAQ